MGWLIAYLIAAVLGFGLWWLTFGIACSMNGLNGAKYGLYLPFVGLWQDLCWRFKPGAAEAWMRQLVNRFPNCEGYIGDYSYSEIREHNLYAEVGRKILAPLDLLLFEHVLVPGAPVLIVSAVHAACRLASALSF